MERIPIIKSEEEKIERIQKTISTFSHLLNDFSDDIPNEIVAGTGNYKVRRGEWLGPVVFDLDWAIRIGLITDEQLIEDINHFTEGIQRRNEERRKALNEGTAEGDHIMTTREEINTANSLLKRTIENLQNSI